jgi:hypothetical protein
MLSLFGSKGRIVQAHMSPESQRLQIRYSEFFDFRKLTQDWLDIFVRWFLNEPLATPMPQSKMAISEPHNTSKHPAEDMAHLPFQSESCISELTEPNAHKHHDIMPWTFQKKLSTPVCSPSRNARDFGSDPATWSPQALLNA